MGLNGGVRDAKVGRDFLEFVSLGKLVEDFQFPAGEA